MLYEITLTNENGDKLDKNFQYGADDVKWSVTVDGEEYTGTMSYFKNKDEYEVEPDGDMPEPWEEVEEAIQNKFSEETGALNTGDEIAFASEKALSDYKHVHNDPGKLNDVDLNKVKKGDTFWIVKEGIEVKVKVI